MPWSELRVSLPSLRASHSQNRTPCNGPPAATDRFSACTLAPTWSATAEGKGAILQRLNAARGAREETHAAADVADVCITVRDGSPLQATRASVQVQSCDLALCELHVP